MRGGGDSLRIQKRDNEIMVASSHPYQQNHFKVSTPLGNTSQIVIITGSAKKKVYFLQTIFLLAWLWKFDIHWIPIPKFSKVSGALVAFPSELEALTGRDLSSILGNAKVLMPRSRCRWHGVNWNECMNTLLTISIRKWFTVNWNCFFF